jgi:phosphoglycolate phosphatase
MLIIFDLDGTLIDSARDLAIATNQTRDHFGLPPLDPKVIQSYVGNGAAMLVRRALGTQASEQLVGEAVLYFLKYYRAHALAHTRLYAGVENLIAGLAADAHTLAVLTNKPTKISADILAGLGVGVYFTRLYGGDSFPQKKPSPIGISTLMEDTSSRAPETWMVGDSAVDVQTARNAEVQACGVAWGFQPESFAQHPPDILIQEPGQLPEALAAFQAVSGCRHS